MSQNNGVQPPSFALIVRAEPGDDYAAIAAQFECDEPVLRAANPGVDTVNVGDELIVPMTPSQCKTDPGDTYESVAAQFGTTSERLRAMNPGVEDLAPGTILNLA